LERQQQGELRARTKAGLIEQRAVASLRPFGLADTIIARGSRNGVCEFRIDGEAFVVDYGSFCDDGLGHYVYPQHELVGDWAEALVAKGGMIRFETRVREILQDKDGVEVRAETDGIPLTVRAEVVVGCDGAGSLAARTKDIATIDVSHPFRWLAVIAAIAPPSPRTILALHRNGFAGQFRRTGTSTRYYLEVPSTDTLADWPDERIWPELELRMTAAGTPPMIRGDLIERDFLDLRVRVREPMQSGRLFIAGDAAHM